MSIYIPSNGTNTAVLNHFSHVQLFVTLWTVAHQAPLFMGFSRQEYWSGWPCPPPGLPDPGSKPVSHVSWIGKRVLYHWLHLGSPVVQESSLFSSPSLVFIHRTFFLNYPLNWRIITSQCCVGFSVRQCESAVSIHICPLSWASLPPLHPTFLGHHGAPGWAPSLHSCFPGAVCFTHGSVYMSVLLS